MFNGTFNNQRILAGETKVVYTIPAEVKKTDLAVSFCNVSSFDALVDMTIGGDGNYHFKNYKILAGDTVVVSGMSLSAGDEIKVKSDVEIHTRVSGSQTFI